MKNKLNLNSVKIRRLNICIYHNQSNFSLVHSFFIIWTKCRHSRQLIKLLRGKFSFYGDWKYILRELLQIIRQRQTCYFVSVQKKYDCKGSCNCISTKLHTAISIARPIVSKQHWPNTNQLSQLKGTPYLRHKLTGTLNISNFEWIVLSILSRISHLIMYVY